MIKIYIDIRMLHKNGKVFKAAIELLKKWQSQSYQITIEKDDQSIPKEIKPFKPKSKTGSLLDYDLIIAKNAVGNQICSDTWWQYFSSFDIEIMIKNRTENEIEDDEE